MDAFITSTLAFIEANAHHAFWIALLFALAETVAVVSIVIPSTAILIGVGGLIATGALSFWPIWAGAAVGALVGSTFSWWLGRRFGPAILRMWPLKNHPENVEKGRAAFARYGASAILVGHFFGPLRSVVFLMCGMAPMALGRFMPWNILGGVAWAAAMPLTGYLGGSLIGWAWRAMGF